MKINVTPKLLLLFLLVSLHASAAVVSRITTFTDGSVLFASDLNAEFNNLVDGVNNLNDSNIISGANIAPSKLSSSIAGNGITRDPSTGILSVNTDNTTIEFGGSGLQVKDLGISTAKIADNAITTVKILDANITTAKILDANVTTGKIADGSVTPAKLSAVNQQVSSSSGNFSTTSVSFVDVTNLSVTITTSGRPVFVGLISDNDPVQVANLGGVSTSAACGAVVKVLRDATQVAQYAATNAGTSTSNSCAIGQPPSAVQTYDIGLAAGTYTYKVQILNAGGTTARLQYSKLVAYEL